MACCCCCSSVEQELLLLMTNHTLFVKAIAVIDVGMMEVGVLS